MTALPLMQQALQKLWLLRKRLLLPLQLQQKGQ
jgi:hypothetical protein